MQKNKLTWVAIACASLLMACQSRDIAAEKVPSVVLNAVKGVYAEQTIEWEKVKENYEAEVQLNDSTEAKLQVDANGKILLHKVDLAHQEVPANLLTLLQQKYPDHRVDDVERLEKDGQTYYQFELEGSGKKDISLVLKADGSEAAGLAYWED